MTTRPRGLLVVLFALLALWACNRAPGNKPPATPPVVVVTPPTPTPAPAGFRWVSTPGFSLAVPQAWVTKTSEAEQLFLDGTAPVAAGSEWIVGDSLLVTQLTAAPGDSRSWSEGCGSHLCSGVLTVVKGTRQFKLRRDWLTDDGGPEGAAEKDVGALADTILATSR